MSGEQMVAVLVATGCAVMLVRLCLPVSRRMQFDHALRRLFRGRDVRKAEAAQAKRARQATAEAIERAHRASRAASVIV